MNKILATSLTTALFLVIGISGVMMFFHFFDSNVKYLHEILGLAFIAAVLFHLFYNWKSMKSYFSKKTFFISLVLTAMISFGFIFQSAQEGENPKRILINSVLTSPIEKSFSILNIEYANAIKKLKNKSIFISEESTIETIANENQISPFEIISIITKK